MAKTYYQFPDDNFPHVTSAVMDAIAYYICTSLYPTEDFETQSSKRFKLANFDSGIEHGVRASIEEFKKVVGNFPVTVYNIGEVEALEEKTNFLEKSGLYYSPYFNKRIQSMPVNFNIEMMSIFTQPSDYFHAKTKLFSMNGILQRLVVPITINGKLDSYTVDIKLEVSKGNLAYQQEEQRNYGKLYDLTHNIIVYMHYFVIPDTVIEPVDNIEVALGILSKEAPQASIIDETFIMHETPVVESTIPVNDTIDIDKTANIIINFNVPMNEKSVEQALDFDPWISAELLWNSDSTQLTIELAEDLQSETEYTIEIFDTAFSAYKIRMEDDYTFKFVTGI